MGFPALEKPTSSKPHVGTRISLRRHLFQNLRMIPLPIRVMRISRRVAATVESVSSSTKVPTSIPSRRRAMVLKLLQLAGPQNPLLPQASLGPPLPQVSLRLLLPQASPNQPHLSRPNSTSRCSASCTEAETGASCSSSTARLAISPPSTHRSSCKLSTLGFGCRAKHFRCPLQPRELNRDSNKLANK